jgi:DNA-binding NtrC family response regulator
MDEKRIVLVVEDETSLRDLAEDILLEDGHIVVTAGSPEEALILLSELHIDVLFTDIVLPGPIDGCALAARVRRTRPGIRIICTSGFPRALEAAGCEACEASLPKPYRAAELREAVRQGLPPPASERHPGST